MSNVWPLSVSMIILAAIAKILKSHVLTNKNTPDGDQILDTYIRLRLAKTFPRLPKNKAYISSEFNEAVTLSLSRENHK